MEEKIKTRRYDLDEDEEKDYWEQVIENWIKECRHENKCENSLTTHS